MSYLDRLKAMKCSETPNRGTALTAKSPFGGFGSGHDGRFRESEGAFGSFGGGQVGRFQKAAQPPAQEEPAPLPDIEDVREFVEERAAIMECDGGLPRPEAERLAVERACVKFKLHDLHGDPPQPGGGYVLGAPGQTVESLLAELRALYGPRLAQAGVKS